MPALSLETVTRLVQAAFLVGALTDGLALVPMLSRRIGVALFGGDVSHGTAAYRYAMGLGASLMAGWTLLLLWGAASPIERRDLLLLTVFPVVTGIVIATVFAARHGVVRVSRLVPLWVHLCSLSIFYVLAYVLSMPYAH